MKLDPYSSQTSEVCSHFGGLPIDEIVSGQLKELTYSGPPWLP